MIRRRASTTLTFGRKRPGRNALFADRSLHTERWRPVTAPDFEWLDGIVVVNIALGALCIGAAVTVLAAAFLDGRERRRWRAMVFDYWPPDAAD
jgi:hypothetical protein